MKKVYQANYSNIVGDCFSACLASILEVNLEDIPNFWLQTQDNTEFWKLSNKFLTENYNCKAIAFSIEENDKFLIQDVLCIAIVKSPDKTCDHAVVWLNKLIHNPNPNHPPITEEPKYFTVLVPLDIHVLSGLIQP